MSEELREAMKRWRKHQRRMDEADSPYYAGTFMQDDAPQLQLAKDLRLMADACVAEHAQSERPAESGEERPYACQACGFKPCICKEHKIYADAVTTCGHGAEPMELCRDCFCDALVDAEDAAYIRGMERAAVLAEKFRIRGVHSSEWNEIAAAIRAEIEKGS